MRWLIVGAGTLGSILAGHLAWADEDITLLARGARAKHLREHGLVITGLKRIKMPVKVVDNPRDLHYFDVIILATKTYDTEAVLTSLTHVRTATAFSIQNGMAKDEQLAAVFGREAVIGCAADFSGEVQPDGSVSFTRNEGLYLGELPGSLPQPAVGNSSMRVYQIASSLWADGLRVIGSGDIQSVEWSKLVGWLALAPLAALSRFNTPRLLQDPDLARLQWQLAKEAAQVTGELGIPLVDLTTVSPALALTTSSEEAWIDQSQRIGEAMAAAGQTSHKVSSLQDLEHGRRLELEETFGYAIARAHELGLGVPRLEMCYRLLKALDRASS